VARAPALEDLRVEYHVVRAPAPGAGLVLPLRSLDLPPTCHTLRISGGGAVAARPVLRPLCRLLPDTARVRTLALAHLRLDATLDLRGLALRALDLDNVDGCVSLSGGVRLRRWHAPR
jgi:hypothetical protein